MCFRTSHIQENACLAGMKYVLVSRKHQLLLLNTAESSLKYEVI